ncbi:MAG TPA: PHP domain-containing protein [Clostridia bacterium]
MLLLETHLHNCEVSPCARVTAPEIPSLYIQKGYNAIAVTNHYSAYAFSLIEGQNSLEKAKNFLNLSNLLVSEAKKQGLKAFLSMEVTLARYQWQDYLIFGDIQEGVLQNPDLYTYTQAQLFDLANKYNWVIFQAHPFRNGCTLGLPRFMHGIEVYNGCHHSKEVYQRSVNFAKKNNLKMSAGGDFHNIGDEGKAGIYIPEDIETEKQLAQYLLNNQPKIFMSDNY